MPKLLVNLDIYGPNAEIINKSLHSQSPDPPVVFKTNCEISGRYLGLLSEDEFSVLLSEKGPKILKKMLTFETKEINSVPKMDDISGKRLVIAVKKKNGLIALQKEIFVSEPLEYTSFYSEGNVGFTAESGAYMTLEEVRKEEELTE